MSIVKGLKAINQSLESNNKTSDEPKVKYLRLKDGETVRVRFLQELDSDSPNYSEKAGLGFLAIEHQHPTDFKKKFSCTIEDEGKCLGCERHSADFKAGYGQKAKLYVNVLVERQQDGETVKEVNVLSQGNGPKSVTPWLLEYAGDEGSITDRVFKMKRTGAGQKDTSYTIMPGTSDTDKYDVSQHALYDLEGTLRKIPYEQQKAFYGEAPEVSSSVEW